MVHNLNASTYKLSSAVVEKLVICSDTDTNFRNIHKVIQYNVSKNKFLPKLIVS